MPHFKDIIISKSKGNYVIAPLSEKEISYIRNEYSKMELNDDEKSDGFTIKINKRVVSSDKIIMFGKSDDWDSTIERRLSNIIINEPLTVRVPLDKARRLIGDRLNTGATIKMAHEYNVAAIGSPKYIIIFKDGRFN